MTTYKKKFGTSPPGALVIDKPHWPEWDRPAPPPRGSGGMFKVLLGFALGYLILTAGVLSGVLLPGDHGVPKAMAATSGEELLATYNCASHHVAVSVHDSDHTIRRLGAGIITFSINGSELDRENWAFDVFNASDDQLIADLNPGLMNGNWIVRVNEASGLSAAFTVAPCPELPASPTPQPGAPTPTPSRPPLGTVGKG